MTDSTNPSPECKPLSDVAANALSWIMVLTALDPGAKWALAALWCRAVDNGGIYVSLATREEIAELSGQGVAAVKKQMVRLGTAGWLRRCGKNLELAWRVPFGQVPSGPLPAPQGVGPSTDPKWPEPALYGAGSGPDGTTWTPEVASPVHPYARASDLVNSPSSPFPSGMEGKKEEGEGCLGNNQVMGRSGPLEGRHGPSKAVVFADTAAVADPRDLPRPASTSGPRPQIAPEIWEVVEKHETTSRWAVDPYGMWAIALADWVSETRAEARHVKAVLDMFEAEATELHRAGMLVKAQNEGTFPKAQNLWFRYGKHASASAWVGKAFERVMTPTVVDSTPTTDARLLRFRGDS